MEPSRLIPPPGPQLPARLASASRNTWSDSSEAEASPPRLKEDQEMKAEREGGVETPQDEENRSNNPDKAMRHIIT